MEFNIFELSVALIVPVGSIIGVYINLKTNVTRNQEKIIALQDDITEIKEGVKDIVNKILWKNYTLQNDFCLLA